MRLHTCVDHDPGTVTCYRRCGCRCRACQWESSEYERRRVRANAQGRPYQVPADDTAAHINRLRAAGVGYNSVARAAGLSRSAIWRIATGRQTRILAGTADAILAVDLPSAVLDGHLVPAGPTKRRIRQMVAAGWTKADIARALYGPDVDRLQLRLDGRITARNARRIALLHTDWRNGKVTP